MGASRLLRRRHRSGSSGVRDPAAAAERDRHPAHGACVQPDHHGRAHPLPPDARLQHALAAGHRPCGHRHPDRGRAPARGEGPVAPCPGPRGVHRPGVGLEALLRRHHHQPDEAARRLGGLRTRVLHDGRVAVDGGGRHVRAPLRAGPDLPRQAAGELGPEARHGGLRPGGRERRGRRPPVGDPLSDRRQCRRRPGGGHHPPRDDARRRGRRRAPGR